MQIDVSGILKEYGGKIDIDCDLEMSDTGFLGEDYHFTKPVKVIGSVSNNGKSLMLKARVEAEVSAHCARCTKPLTVCESFELDEVLIQDNGEEINDLDVVAFEGHTFELDELVMNGFFMNVSGKYLCKEDCKGLCPECGADLNEGECGCAQTSVDPRWAGLLDIMNQSADE